MPIMNALPHHYFHSPPIPSRTTSQKNMMEHEGGIDTTREQAYKMHP